MDDIEAKLGLDQERLIMLSLFLGCDYTDGVKGVGIVNGMEIIGAYNTFDSLRRFSDWACKPDLWNDPKHYEKAKEKYPQEFNYMVKHKNYKNVWELPTDFPNVEVIKAFSQPNVKSPKKIKYGTPDFKNIEIFCREILKLKPHEIEYIIDPIRNEYEKRKDQPKITKYFDRGRTEGTIVSTRLLSSVNSLINNSRKAKLGIPTSADEDNDTIKSTTSQSKGAMEEEPNPVEKGKRKSKGKKVKKITGSKAAGGKKKSTKPKKGKRTKKGVAKKSAVGKGAKTKKSLPKSGQVEDGIVQNENES
jgi:hypothetical protein